MGTNMPTNIRLTTAEQEVLRKRGIEINRELVRRGLQPLKESEIVHAVLEDAISGMELNAEGKVVLRLVR